MPPKRKRTQADDEDEDTSLLGNQVLPIANLPDDFAGEPEDGMQYLFLVRRDARSLPNTTRVTNPYATPNIQEPSSTQKPPHPCIPSEDWRAEFENKASPSHSSKPDPGMPKPKDRDGWLAYINGGPSVKEKEASYGPSTAFTPRSVSVANNRPANIQSAGIIDDEPEPALEEDSPRLPTPSILKSLDDHGTIHLLMFVAYWIRRSLDYSPSLKIPPTRPLHFPKHHQQWTFSLLAHLDTGLRSEEISHLRELARACIAVVREDLEGEGPAIVDQSTVGGRDEREEEKGKYSHLTGVWMVIAAIASIWGQRDMWQNAEEALADLVLVRRRKTPKIEPQVLKIEPDRPDVEMDVVNPFSSAHRLHVKSLYKRYLIDALNWNIRRDLWRNRAIEIRAEFERNRNVTDPRAIAQILGEAEERLAAKSHPDPYIHAMYPGGTKWERNLPPPMEKPVPHM
ncbi:Survival motor neuron (SMN) interacting protein 1, partial [Rhizoctonia solani]